MLREGLGGMINFISMYEVMRLSIRNTLVGDHRTSTLCAVPLHLTTILLFMYQDDKVCHLLHPVLYKYAVF